MTSHRFMMSMHRAAARQQHPRDPSQPLPLGMTWQLLANLSPMSRARARSRPPQWEARYRRARRLGRYRGRQHRPRR